VINLKLKEIILSTNVDIMNIEFSYFWLSKAGNDENECDDALFPYNISSDIVLQNQKFKRFAIADGASTAYLSGMWATTLVDGFGSYNGEINDSNFFDLLQTVILDQSWNTRFTDYLKKREENGNSLSWHDEMALQNGTGSTLLEISFPVNDGKIGNIFSALAIGDSCLFQIRNDELIVKFPLNDSVDFDNTPALISNESKRNAELNEKIAYLENQNIIEKDRLFLMTDALAFWFLQAHENGNTPWHTIEENTRDKSSFTDWIECLREYQQIRNDDVTLMILKIQEDE
jgi:hypothetical protein